MLRVINLSRPIFPLLCRKRQLPYGVGQHQVEDGIVRLSLDTWRRAGVEPRGERKLARIAFVSGNCLWNAIPILVPILLIATGILAYQAVQSGKSPGATVALGIFVTFFCAVSAIVFSVVLTQGGRAARLRPQRSEPSSARSGGAGTAIRRLGISCMAAGLLGAPAGPWIASRWGRQFGESAPSGEIRELLQGGGIIISLLIPGALLALGYLIWRGGRRLTQASADELRLSDARTPIVYLRSFRDEDASVVVSKGRDGQAHEERFEEIVVPALKPFGPVVAIGRPGERLPELGASRNYYSDAQWKDAISKWLGEALIVVMVAGSTSGLQWELQSIAREHRGKLLLLVPPSPPADAADRWTMIKSALESGAGIALPSVMPQRARAVFIEPDNTTVILETSSNDSTSYATTIRYAIYGMLCRPA